MLIYLSEDIWVKNMFFSQIKLNKMSLPFFAVLLDLPFRSLLQCLWMNAYVALDGEGEGDGEEEEEENLLGAHLLSLGRNQPLSANAGTKNDCHSQSVKRQ